MQKGLRLKNLKFFDGLQNYEESNAIPENKLYNCNNARFSKRIIFSKPGYQALGNASVGGTKIQGIYNYPYWDGSALSEKLIRFYNNAFEIFDESTQTWTPITTTWANVADSFTDGVNYNNVIYFVNPLTSGTTGGVGKISNSTFSVVANSPVGFAIESWVERLWVIGDRSRPNAIIGSRAATASVPANIEDWSTGTIIELVGKDGRNVAIRVLENNFFVFKEDSIWYNTNTNIASGNTQFLELSRTGGAINQKSTIIVENDVWFLSANQGLQVRRLGIERQLGDNPRTKDLTAIIQRSMDLLDPIQDNPVMSYSNRLVKLNLKTKGSPTNNFRIIFDYNTGNYTIDRGQAVNVNTVWKNYLVYGEDATGQAFVDDNGYTANGAAFSFTANTGFIDDNRPDITKRARYIYFKGKQSYNQSITVKLFRDNDYNTYSSYTIPSPAARGVSQNAFVDDGTQGSAQQGASVWGGTPTDTSNDIQMYKTEYPISVSQRSNMFALGLDTEINGGKVECEQLILKVIDDNENYQRSKL